jgi:hypothetical protein
MKTVSPAEVEDIIIGDGNTEIKAACSTLADFNGVDPILNTRSWKVPEESTQGYSEAFQQPPDTFKLKFLFYRGMHEDSNANTYPLGGHTIRDFAGSKIADYSLIYQGENSLYVNFYQTWLAAMSETKKIILPLLLGPAELQQINWNIPYRYKASLYILGKLNVTARPHSLSPTIAELYRIPSPWKPQ